MLNIPLAALKRSAAVTSLDPLTLLPVLAMMTEQLGLIATASTTFAPPYKLSLPRPENAFFETRGF